MRVVFDLRVCHLSQERGIPRYVMALLEHLVRQNASDRYAVLIHKNRNEITRLKHLSTNIETLYYEDVIASGLDGRCDIFLAGNLFPLGEREVSIERYIIPPPIHALRPLKAVIAFDLIPLIFANEYLSEPVTRHYYNLCLNAMRHFDVVFSISDNTTRDLIDRGGIRPSRIVTMKGGIEPSDWQISPMNKKKKSILFVGGDDFRKNLVRSIQAFAIASRQAPDYRMSIVCGLTKDRQASLEADAMSLGLSVGGNIEFTGVVSDGDLRNRLQSAEISIFPSLYEGLGLPILESYACGTPVIGSNSSAVRDLIHPDCMFDPESASDISEKLVQAIVDKTIQERSILFGAEIVKHHAWPNCAALVGKSLHDRLTKKENKAAPTDRLAFFGTLMPDRSGIATYNTKTFGGSNFHIDYYTQIDALDELKAKAFSLGEHGAKQHRVFRNSDFWEQQGRSKYKALVFSFGNSGHNLCALEAALAIKPFGVPRFFYLHEARFTSLLFSYFGSWQKVVAQMSEDCPDIEKYQSDPERIASSDHLGARTLLKLVGAGNIIVNSNHCKKLIEDQLAGSDERRVDVLFLPIFEGRNATEQLREPSTHGELVVGHFGIPAGMKACDDLLEACVLLNKRRPIKLLFSGYEADKHIDVRAIPEFVFIRPDLSDAEFCSDMAAVDVAVQLRRSHHGESSGVVRELLGLGKKVIVSSGGPQDELGEFVNFVDPTISPAELATVIERVASEATPIRSFQHFSVTRFLEQFADVIDR